MSGRYHLPTSWLTAALLLVVQPAAGQGKADRALETVGPEAERICLLAPVQDDTGVRNVPSARPAAKALGQTSTFGVEFVDEDASDSWPTEARDAFTHATTVWERTIVSPHEIRVRAYWADRGGCVTSPVTLASAGPRGLYRDHPSFPRPDTWYVDALADALSGLDMGGSGQPDIRVFVNRDCDNPDARTPWYFGLDGNPPAGQVDFISVVLHEIGHGLGISGAGHVTSGTGTVRYSSRPYAYDRFTVDGSMPSSPLLAYPDVSPELGAALQSGSGGVLYSGTRASTVNGGEAPSLYAPNPWTAGSSYSHLDEATYNNTSDALMTPMLSTMEANHVVGPVTCAILEDMGWTVSNGSCDVSLPVELVDFRALLDGQDVILTWQTASEVNNAGFAIEHSRGDGPFETVAFEAGASHATSERFYEHTIYGVGAGRHAFRLVQMDYDGSSTYSEVVEVTIDGGLQSTLSPVYPNPFRDVAHMTLTVGQSQNVDVVVVDMLGRMVLRLFSGYLVEGYQTELRLEGASLPSGVYAVHVAGDEFVQSRPIVLVR